MCMEMSLINICPIKPNSVKTISKPEFYWEPMFSRMLSKVVDTEIKNL